MDETPSVPMTRPNVYGVDMDSSTRCAHYRTALDVIAIKLGCCEEFYACKECHDELSNHEILPWPRGKFDTVAILCGECDTQLTINAYLSCGNRCPSCGTAFNPRCSLHHHFYFSDG